MLFYNTIYLFREHNGSCTGENAEKRGIKRRSAASMTHASLDEKEIITNELAKWIAQSSRPLKIVRDEGFRVYSQRIMEIAYIFFKFII